MRWPSARKIFISIENGGASWNISFVLTIKADDQKRLLVPQAKPGQVYAVQENTDGSFTLTAVKAAELTKPNCRLGKEDGFTVVVPDQAINEQAIKELLADFP